MQYLIGFLIGFAGSVAASLILSSGRAFWRNFLNVLFRKLYPSIQGRYLVTVPRACMQYPDDKTILEIHQFGIRVSGSLTFLHKEAIELRVKVEGKITPSRYLSFTYEAPNANHNQYGSGLYRLESNGTDFKGHISYICVSCQKTYSAESTLERITDKA